MAWEDAEEELEIKEPVMFEDALYFYRFQKTMP
jgi:hypothetical protein